MQKVLTGRIEPVFFVKFFILFYELISMLETLVNKELADRGKINRQPRQRIYAIWQNGGMLGSPNCD